MQQKGIAASIPQVQYEGNGNGNSLFGTDPAQQKPDIKQQYSLKPGAGV